MKRRLDAAEAEARKAVDEWIAHGVSLAAIPGASVGMFLQDQQMLARVAEAFEVDRTPAGPFWSAYGLAWARGSLDASLAFNPLVAPWLGGDVRCDALRKTNEQFAEAVITAMRARSRLT